jgi:hypothetical protein
MITFSQLMKLTGATVTASVIAVAVTSPAAMAGPGPAVNPHSLATTTWTVSPGGSFTGKAGTSTFQDATTGATISCPSATITGALKSGSGLAGKGLGTITSMTFSKCSLDGMAFSLSSGTVDWSLNAVSYNTRSDGVASGNITGLHFTISSTNCTAVADGTSGTADNGKVRFTFNNKTSHLKIVFTGGNLHVWDVNGCLGLFGNGDPATGGTCPATTPRQKVIGGPGPGPSMTGPPC